MKKLKTIKTLFVLAILLTQTMFPTTAKAKNIVFFDKIANNSQKEAILSENPEGKLAYLTYSVKKSHKEVKTVLTAYSSTPDQTDGNPFVGASGKRVYDGMVAANWLPFGTKVKIPALFGNKIFTVDDRMNPRYGYGRMDIWMNASRSQASRFGVRHAVVEIYYPETTTKVAKVDSI